MFVYVDVFVHYEFFWQRLYFALFKFQKTLNLDFFLFKFQKKINHVISDTCKDNILIHDFTSSTVFSTPNLFNARDKM